MRFFAKTTSEQGTMLRDVTDAEVAAAEETRTRVDALCAELQKIKTELAAVVGACDHVVYDVEGSPYDIRYCRCRGCGISMGMI